MLSLTPPKETPSKNLRRIDELEGSVLVVVDVREGLSGSARRRRSARVVLVRVAHPPSVELTRPVRDLEKGRQMSVFVLAEQIASNDFSRPLKTIRL